MTTCRPTYRRLLGALLAALLLVLATGCAATDIARRVEPFVGDESEPLRVAAFSTPDRADRGRVYGLFVAVSHYHGAARDLPDAASTVTGVASRLLHAMPDEARAVVLTDEDATRARLVSTARALAIRVRPVDTVVLVFHLHGDDDALLLEDGTIAGAQLARLLDAMPCRVLLVVNACGAGGLARALGSRADRGGIFSSDADQATYGSAMLRAFGNALAHRVGRVPGGGLRVGAIAEYVARASRLEHPTELATTPLGVITRRWHTTIGEDLDASALGGRLSPADAATTDCRALDGCVRVDTALDHVLDPLDDTGSASAEGGAERRRE